LRSNNFLELSTQNLNLDPKTLKLEVITILKNT